MVQLGIALLAASLNYKPGVETINLPIAAGTSQYVALHCVAPKEASHKGVLFIHGSSFPTMLAAGFEFQRGDSWMDFTARHGFLACGLDFLGYGASSRPPVMFEPADGKQPLLRAPEAASEIAVAIAYMQGRRHISEVHIVAHSWGTIPAADFAAGHPGTLTSLTLFGPIVPKAGSAAESENVAWWRITSEERLRQLYFKQVLPPNLVLLEPAVTSKWAAAFQASAPHIAGDAPGEIRIPDGPNADIEAANDAIYPYAPGQVTAPLFAVYGDYDTESARPASATTAFLEKFTSTPLKWQLCIHDGTHVMHLERNRMSLYESVLGFMRAAEQLKK